MFETFGASGHGSPRLRRNLTNEHVLSARSGWRAPKKKEKGSLGPLTEKVDPKGSERQSLANRSVFAGVWDGGGAKESASRHDAHVEGMMRKTLWGKGGDWGGSDRNRGETGGKHSRLRW